MSKRSTTISSLFAVPLAAESHAPAVGRVASGSVNAMRSSFSEIERENEELRQRFESGTFVVELDPNLIEPSPTADRFVDNDTQAFEVLKSSIAERGQEVPILVREHPLKPGFYQSAYGHRRVRAARELALQVKAIVKALSDEDLTISQGIENAAREDLSFIERATFALRIEQKGFDRSVIQKALAVDRAGVSKFIAVATAIPFWLIEAIGPAHAIGRPRWMALAELLQAKSAQVPGLEQFVLKGAFKALASDARFISVLAQLTKKSAAPPAEAIFSSSGKTLATLEKSKRGLKLKFVANLDPQFTDYLCAQMPEIYAQWERSARQA